MAAYCLCGRRMGGLQGVWTEVFRRHDTEGLVLPSVRREGPSTSVFEWFIGDA